MRVFLLFTPIHHCHSCTARHHATWFCRRLFRVRPERAGMSSERLDRLDAVLKSYVENEQLAGQVAMVLRKGRVVFRPLTAGRIVSGDPHE